MDAVFELLGKAVGYGVLPAGAAFIIFRIMGEGWLKARLDTQLETIRHANNESLEQLRYEIQRALDSTTRLTTKEYEVLPKAWRLLHLALGLVRLVVSHAREYPDLDRLSETELEEYLAASTLKDSQKQRIRVAPRKTDEYIKILFWIQLNDTRNACRRFHRYVLFNSVFLSPELKAAFDRLDDIMWSATVDREVSEQIRGSPGAEKPHEYWQKAYDSIKNNAEPIVREIEGMIQTRLRHELRRNGGPA